MKKFYSLATSSPPPSYDSIYGRVMEAQKQSKGFLDFLKNIFILLLGTSKLNRFFVPKNVYTLFTLCSWMYNNFMHNYCNTCMYGCHRLYVFISVSRRRIYSSLPINWRWIYIYKRILGKQIFLQFHSEIKITNLNC